MLSTCFDFNFHFWIHEYEKFEIAQILVFENGKLGDCGSKFRWLFAGFTHNQRRQTSRSNDPSMRFVHRNPNHQFFWSSKCERKSELFTSMLGVFPIVYVYN